MFFTPEISESPSREFYEKLNASFKEDYGLSDMLEPEERGRYLWRTDCVRKRASIFCSPRSGTWFSRLIHLATDDSYTHASIGLDGPAGPFYSFARKYERFALPAGLVVEEVGVETKRGQIPCCLYELSVPVPVYDCLRRQLNRMYAQRDRYHYNLLGALTCYFNYPLPRENHYFCSQFAASLLERSGAVELGKTPDLVRPADFCQIDRFRPVYQGELGNLREAVPA